MKTPTKRPESPLDSIYRQTDLAPEQIFQALGRLRREAEQQVEYLIELIDAIDGDADLEPTTTDPRWVDRFSDRCCDDEREDVCEDEGAQCDDEGNDSDNGIADLDGLMEQCPAMFEGHDQRVLA